jgi:predicted dehydrogenase
MIEGGPLIGCGPHQIDLASFWLGSPVVRFAAHGAWADEYEAPDHVWLHLDHADGAHTVVEVSYSFGQTAQRPWHEFVYELIGTDGVLRYDRERQRCFAETSTGTRELEFHHEKSFEGLYVEWANALRSGHSELLTSAEDGARVVEIARAAIDAVIRGRRVAG